MTIKEKVNGYYAKLLETMTPQEVFLSQWYKIDKTKEKYDLDLIDNDRRNRTGGMRASVLGIYLEGEYHRLNNLLDQTSEKLNAPNFWISEDERKIENDEIDSSKELLSLSFAELVKQKVKKLKSETDCGKEKRRAAYDKEELANIEVLKAAIPLPPQALLLSSNNQNNNLLNDLANVKLQSNANNNKQKPSSTVNAIFALDEINKQKEGLKKTEVKQATIEKFNPAASLKDNLKSRVENNNNNLSTTVESHKPEFLGKQLNKVNVNSNNKLATEESNKPAFLEKPLKKVTVNNNDTPSSQPESDKSQLWGERVKRKQPPTFALAKDNNTVPVDELQALLNRRKEKINESLAISEVDANTDLQNSANTEDNSAGLSPRSPRGPNG